MDVQSLLGMSLICVVGAISPGPSLAVVLRNTISRGRIEGVMTGIGHGLGFTIYAFMVVIGFSFLPFKNEKVFSLFQIAGALVLIRLAFNMITHKKLAVSEAYEESGYKSGYRGFIEGLMIAFFNPKILVFLVAVFSQFIDPNASNYNRFLMAAIAGIIDMAWYALVAAVLSVTTIVDKLRLYAVIIDRLIGTILLTFALSLILKILGSDNP